MASPSGNAGWAQLRQQARSLENQVGVSMPGCVHSMSCLTDYGVDLLDGESVSYLLSVLCGV
jgi:membrane-bound lytic murein transglycosylase B